MLYNTPKMYDVTFPYDVPQDVALKNQMFGGQIMPQWQHLPRYGWPDFSRIQGGFTGIGFGGTAPRFGFPGYDLPQAAYGPYFQGNVNPYFQANINPFMQGTYEQTPYFQQTPYYQYPFFRAPFFQSWNPTLASSVGVPFAF